MEFLSQHKDGEDENAEKVEGHFGSRVCVCVVVCGVWCVWCVWCVCGVCEV